MLQLLMSLLESGEVVTLPATITAFDGAGAPSPASASLSINTNGTITFTGSSNPGTQVWSIPNPPGDSTDYDVRLDTISGTLDVGNADTWENISTTRTYQMDAVSTVDIFTGTLRIRPAGGGADLATSAVDIEADSS